MKNLIVFLMLSAFASGQAAEELVGDWKGRLTFGGQGVDIVLHITAQKGERVEGTLDIPQQGALGLAFSEMVFRNDSLLCKMDMVQAHCVLKKSNDRLEGIWYQSGVESTMNLVRSSEDLRPKRPQEPKPPFPYDQREVTFNAADGSLLEGTLVLPHGITDPVPAVVLVSGSGPQDRDESLSGHKPFLVIADFLARQGIASLRYDERGVGKSGGDFASATTQDFLQDALKGVEFLRAQQHIDGNNIGVVGHSEGGLIATKLAAENAIDFGVALAGPSLRGDNLLLIQSERIFGASGMGALLPVQLAVQKAAFSAVVEHEDAAQREQAALQRIEAVKQKHGAQALIALGLNAEGIQTFVSQVNQPWMVEFLSTSAIEGVSSLQVPFFFAYGSKDVQVPAEENIAALRNAGIVENSSAVKVKVYPDLNHLFQTAKSGLPNEYAMIEETFNNQVLQDVADFILKAN